MVALRIALTGSEVAAQTAQDHAAHHPTADSAVSATGTRWEPVAATPAPMMAKVPPELVPSLTRLTVPTDADRRDLERLAVDRMLEGTEHLARGVARLARAEEVGEYGAMGSALAEIRFGLGSLESAVSARAALDTTTAPAVIADSWLRAELSLPDVVSRGKARPLSLFHLVLMTILLLFTVSMAVIHYRRVRAIEALLARTSLSASAPSSESAAS